MPLKVRRKGKRKKFLPFTKAVKKYTENEKKRKLAEMMRTAKCFEYAGLDIKIFFHSLPSFMCIFIDFSFFCGFGTNKE